MLSLAVALAVVVQPPAPEVDRQRLMDTLRELPVSRSATAGPESVAGLDKTRDLIVERLQGLGLDPRIESVRWAIPARDWPGRDAPKTAPDTPTEVPAPQKPPRAWQNIIVDLRGTGAPEEIFLVGAHYDAAPGAPGADDNGTGVAALLELARVLKDRPRHRTIRLAFFTLEEVGLEGSKAHARTYSERRPEPTPDAPAGPERLVGMISLEMIGYYTDAPGSQRSPVKEIPGVFTPPTVGDFLSAVTVSPHATFCRQIAADMQAGAPGLKVLPFDILPVPVPDMLRSDHAPFLATGVPAIMLTDTANFRNPNYHRATDTPDTIDAARFTLAVRGLSAAVESMAREGAPGLPKTKTPGPAKTGR